MRAVKTIGTTLALMLFLLVLTPFHAHAEGWKQIGGTWYWFQDWGTMVTGTVSIDGVLQDFSNNGAWQGRTGGTGWQKVKLNDSAYMDNAWYYVDDTGKVALGWKKSTESGIIL